MRHPQRGGSAKHVAPPQKPCFCDISRTLIRINSLMKEGMKCVVYIFAFANPLYFCIFLESWEYNKWFFFSGETVNSNPSSFSTRDTWIPTATHAGYFVSGTRTSYFPNTSDNWIINYHHFFFPCAHSGPALCPSIKLPIVTKSERCLLASPPFPLWGTCFGRGKWWLWIFWWLLSGVVDWSEKSLLVI